MFKLSSESLRLARIAVSFLYSFEGGLLLVVLPWSRLWDHNGLVMHYGALRWLATSTVARGAVSGIGAALILDGLCEFVSWAFPGRGPKEQGR